MASEVPPFDELGGDEEGTPLTVAVTPAPTAVTTRDMDDYESTSGGSIAGPDPTYVPTAPKGPNNYEDETYSDYPTKTPTTKPTVLYIPKTSIDPVEEETEPAGEDGIFYHGLGEKLGKVGEYLEGVESPQELQKDKNVQLVASVMAVVTLVLLLVTAHMVMQYPDGLCAGSCRLTLKCMCCFIRTLCLPCRAICCKGSEQAQGRRTHAPMRTPFPTDLELA